MNNKILLCSDCFQDEGLRLDSLNIGIDINEKCPNCSSRNGKKLDAILIKEIAYRFYVQGTFQKTQYGGAPIIQFNKHQKRNKSEIGNGDMGLIEKAINIGFFPYGPRLWMIGEIEPLKSLQNTIEREGIIKRIIKEYPVKILKKDEIFYRLRKNPKQPNNIHEYDSPPSSGTGRLDSDTLSIFYGSQDLEVCIHECRVSVEDELYIASVLPYRNLKLLDLSALLDENETEFESLDLAMNFLFYAGDHSYEISRRIAKEIEEAGFDGIIYPSYFSTMRTGSMPFETVYGISLRRLPIYSDHVKSQVIPNIALFGRPIKEGKIKVKCINRLMLSKVKYEYRFGPIDY